MNHVGFGTLPTGLQASSTGLSRNREVSFAGRYRPEITIDDKLKLGREEGAVIDEAVLFALSALRQHSRSSTSMLIYPKSDGSWSSSADENLGDRQNQHAQILTDDEHSHFADQEEALDFERDPDKRAELLEAHIRDHSLDTAIPVKIKITSTEPHHSRVSGETVQRANFEVEIEGKTYHSFYALA